MDRASWVCPRDPETLAVARRWITTLLGEQLDEPTLAAAHLIVTELLTNAIQHSDGRVELTIVSGSDCARIEVADEDVDGDVAPSAGPDDQDRGRGLRLVDAHAHRWGCERNQRGKSVWAEIDLDGARPAPPAQP